MAFVAIVGVGLGGYQMLSHLQKDKLSDLMLENIEALATDEEKCNNVNGYRQWSPDWHLFQGGKKEFYDCCFNKQIGYAPKGECRFY